MRYIKNLEDVHKYLPDGYHEACIEISGYCNAKCKYCPSGKASSQKRKMMDAETFKAIVSKLQEYKIIGDGSHVNLFWWGEPFLNPNLKQIIKVTQDRGVEYILSTNAFFYQQLEQADVKNLKRLIISMPGFSQESYNRIHQFDFEVIKENIKRYANDLERAGCKDKIWLAYHVYQFNINEIYSCYEFCHDLGIAFDPGFAFPLLVEERVKYAKGELDAGRKEEMLKEIVTDQLDKMIASSTRTECIYQTRNFVVDEFGEVYGCLNLEHNEANACGNLFNDDINDILKRIYELKACDECIACGVAPTDMSFRFYFDSWFQMMKIRKFYEDCCSKMDVAKGKIMLTLRETENDIDDTERRYKFVEVKELMVKDGIGISEVEEIIDCYGKRPSELKKNFYNFLRGE